MPNIDVRRKEYSMGLSSNARLLSITARLTSNEYESQQVSNAKMRLATKTQQASEKYLASLSETDYSFMSFDAQGNAMNIPLTAAVLYQYGASKNQYMLSNAAGQALLSREDAYHYENSANLKEFLESYGIKANFRTTTLESYYNYLNGDGKTHLADWNALMDEYKAKPEYSTDNWAAEYTQSKEVYNAVLDNYNKVLQELADGNTVFSLFGIKYDEENNEYSVDTDTDGIKMVKYEDWTGDPKEPVAAGYYLEHSDELVDAMAKLLSNVKEQYASCVTYDAYIEAIIRSDSANQTTYENYDTYLENYNNFNIEMEELGISMDEVYSYDDITKARWYTNLWYRINGDSINKSSSPNYTELDSKLLTSTSWIKDALAHGDISIEMASYTQSENLTVDGSMPTIKDLKGISWTTKMFSSCPDITQSDNNKAIEKAEAEYQKAMAEINVKDEKYQRKLNTLDTEHNALQTEYESVKSALSKNIERSFKAFQG